MILTKQVIDCFKMQTLLKLKSSGKNKNSSNKNISLFKESARAQMDLDSLSSDEGLYNLKIQNLME